MKHCCNELNYILEENRTNMLYDSQLREYQMRVSKSKAYYHMIFCPWCGKQFTPSLNKEFFEILEKEYGIDDYHPNKIPKEFKTDEWWKKRGL